MEREKNRKKSQLLTEAAEMFDLPADVVAGLPHVELMGTSMLGHYSSGFTLDTYTHVTDKMQQEAAEKMGNFMEMTF